MYKNHASLLHNLGVIAFAILNFCPELNINTIRDINLQPFLNKHLFGEHPSVNLFSSFHLKNCINFHGNIQVPLLLLLPDNSLL